MTPTIVTIDVPYKGPGNSIVQRPVSFQLVKQGSTFELIPQLGENERRLANLPEALRFVMQGGVPVSLRGDRDGNFHVIRDVVDRLGLGNEEWGE